MLEGVSGGKYPTCLRLSSLVGPRTVGPRTVGPRTVRPRTVGPRTVGPRGQPFQFREGQLGPGQPGPQGPTVQGPTVRSPTVWCPFTKSQCNYHRLPRISLKNPPSLYHSCDICALKDKCLKRVFFLEYKAASLSTSKPKPGSRLLCLRIKLRLNQQLLNIFTQSCKMSRI